MSPSSPVVGVPEDAVRKSSASIKASSELETHVYETSVRNDVYDGEDEDAVDPVYHAKARILNAAFQEIGMGRYQWWLFFVAGFGWFADNVWLIVSGLIMNPVVNEFAGFHGPFIILSENIGLLIGSLFWGIGSDVWGRRWSFNLTLLMTGIFAVAGGAAPNAISLCILCAIWSIGAGGNLPVDSAVFLEFVPATHQSLLTVLSIWWAIGQLVASLIAWPLIANFSCAEKEGCTRSANMGWRYTLWTMGGLMLVMWGIRFFVFNFHESPKYLIGRGRDAEAVAVVHAVAKFNGKTSTLTLDMLQEVDKAAPTKLKGSAKGVLARKLKAFSMGHVTALFKTKKMAYSTSLLIVLWAFIGLGFNMYNGFVTVFLQLRGADFGDGSLNITYRNQVILSILGIPGCLLVGWLVELKALGRKGTLAISTALTGVFLLASTTARTSNALLGWNCGYTFTNNVMYATLYAVSPEVFPGKDRGTGNAIVSAVTHLLGVIAPLVTLYANLTTSVPVYVSGAMFVVAGFIAMLLPFEPRGRASI